MVSSSSLPEIWLPARLESDDLPGRDGRKVSTTQAGDPESHARIPHDKDVVL